MRTSLTRRLDAAERATEPPLVFPSADDLDREVALMGAALATPPTIECRTCQEYAHAAMDAFTTEWETKIPTPSPDRPHCWGTHPEETP